jgi:hypothetical protein
MEPVDEEPISRSPDGGDGRPGTMTPLHHIC